MQQYSNLFCKVLHLKSGELFDFFILVITVALVSKKIYFRNTFTLKVIKHRDVV